MTFRKLIAIAVFELTLIVLPNASAFCQLLRDIPARADIDTRVTAAIDKLYAQDEAAKTLGARAKGVLVFPDVRKAAFMVGVQRGYGALRSGSGTVGYYHTAAASYGFQAGVKQFGYALFFMTDSALEYLNRSGGWAIGTGPSVVVVDQGMARSLNTTNMRADVYAFIFDQKGLMGGIGIEGSKITKITPRD